MGNSKKLGFTSRYVITFGVVLLFANMLLGIVVLNQSEGAMKSLIHKNMLDIANSAAGFMDGDAMGALTEDDVGGEAYNEIYENLSVFQRTVEIEFIYAVRKIDGQTYVFTVDPDPVDPGKFGEPVVITDALVAAGNGVASVDSSPMADRWGNFYSAYSPVFDSSGAVAGIIGIDFSAAWYKEQVWKHTVSITIVTALSVLVGGVIVFLITTSVRRRFKELDAGLSTLSKSVDQLMAEMGTFSGHDVAKDVDPSLDELETLSRKICAMQDDMLIYLDYLHTQAYTDALTHVGSSTAYHERVGELEARIAAGTAAFSVMVFDVNSLKEINDRLGHEVGDLVIRGTAEAVSEVFGASRTYRIGGDEFAALADDIGEGELAAVDAAVAAFNARAHGVPVMLAVSKGYARFDPATDTSFREVFSRADEAMYREKKAYYESVGNRRSCQYK